MTTWSQVGEARRREREKSRHAASSWGSPTLTARKPCRSRTGRGRKFFTHHGEGGGGERERERRRITKREHTSPRDTTRGTESHHTAQDITVANPPICVQTMQTGERGGGGTHVPCMGRKRQGGSSQAAGRAGACHKADTCRKQQMEDEGGAHPPCLLAVHTTSMRLVRPQRANQGHMAKVNGNGYQCQPWAVHRSTCGAMHRQ